MNVHYQLNKDKVCIDKIVNNFYEFLENFERNW